MRHPGPATMAAAAAAACLSVDALHTPAAAAYTIRDCALSKGTTPLLAPAAYVARRLRRPRPFAWTLRSLSNDLSNGTSGDPAPGDILEAERRFYEQQQQRDRSGEAAPRGSSSSSGRSAAAAVPTERECHQYRWFQTDRVMSVEVPLLRACTEEQLAFVLTEEGMQISIRGDADFRPLEGFFPGAVDVAASSYSLHSDGGTDHYLALLLSKRPAAAGTTEMWYSLLEGESPTRTVRFRGRADPAAWRQTRSEIDITFALPPDSGAVSAAVEADGAGGHARLRVTVEGAPGLERLERRLLGAVNVEDCYWVVDGDGRGGRELCVTVAKRYARGDYEAQWWGGLFVEEGRWGE